MQYSIRNIPPQLDAALRKRAKQLGKSLNAVALEALANVVQQPVRRIDLSAMPHGFLSKPEHAALKKALAEQRGIDPEIWE